MFKNVNGFLRTLVYVGVVVLVGWWTLLLRGKLNEHEDALEERDAQIATLETNVRARDARIEDLDATVRKLESAVRLLKVDHRVARIQVLGQDAVDEGPGPLTSLRFTELDSEGRTLGQPVELEVLGSRLYLESLVIKFEDDYVEGGDFLRGTSVCLFRRAFGEHQTPEQGVPIEIEGRLPAIYTGDDDPDPFYADLWERFWDYANDPEAAAAVGVRAMHGEAPFMQVRPGRSYLVELRSSGGLTIRAE